MCAESPEIIPNVWHGANFAEGMSQMSSRHFSLQAQCSPCVGDVEYEFRGRRRKL